VAVPGWTAAWLSSRVKCFRIIKRPVTDLLWRSSVDKSAALAKTKVGCRILQGWCCAAWPSGAWLGKLEQKWVVEEEQDTTSAIEAAAKWHNRLFRVRE
jgi:hypothetical protein